MGWQEEDELFLEFFSVAEWEHDGGGISLGAAGSDQLLPQRIRSSASQATIAFPAERSEQRRQSQ